jgi:hypothetical protein
MLFAQAQDAMIEHNSTLAGPGPASTEASSSHSARESVSSDPAPCATEAVPARGESSVTDDATPSFDLTQKDFAIALGLSPARVSQLVKIGMPLHSISAAKEWRIEQQRAMEEPFTVDDSAANTSTAVAQKAPSAHDDSLASTALKNQVQPITILDSPVTSVIKDSLVDLVSLKKTITRELLESFTTLELRAFCQPRGLKVCGYKNDLVCRLIAFFVSDARATGNHAQLEALSLQDLQRVCREQMFSTSGTKEDIVMRLMAPPTATLGKHGRELDSVDASHATNESHASGSESSSAPRRRAVVTAGKDSEDVVLPSAVLPPPPRVTTASNRASNSPSLIPASSSERISRALTRAKPSCTAMASSGSGHEHAFLQNIAMQARPAASPHTKTMQPPPSDSLNNKIVQAQPPAAMLQPRPQYASLDLFFPVPMDTIVPVTAPILFDTYPPPLDAECTPFTLIENSPSSAAQHFPSFALPPPPRCYTKASQIQNPPPGMGLSTCVATLRMSLHWFLQTLTKFLTRYYQRTSGLATSTCKLCGAFVQQGSRAHHLRSKHPEFINANASIAAEDAGFVAACASKSCRNSTPVRLSAELFQMISGLNQHI